MKNSQKTFLENEIASGPTGGEWEYLLIAASNGWKEIDKIPDANVKKTCEKWWDKGFKEKALNIIKEIKIKKFQKVPNGEVSQMWKKYFLNISNLVKVTNSGTIGTPNGTAKTDLISNSTSKYSLKKAGGSQLMSGFRAEALATLFAAFDLSSKTKATEYAKSFKKQIDNITIGMGGSPDDYGIFESASDITDLLKNIHDEYLHSIGIMPDKKNPNKSWRPTGIKYDDPTVISQIKKQKSWKELEKKVKGYIEASWKKRDWHSIAENSFLEIFKDEKIWSNFLLEASSGIKKFGENTEQCAEYILEFDPENPNDTYSVTIKDFVNKYKERVKVSVSFKTAGGRVNDSLRLVIGPERKNKKIVQNSSLDSNLKNIFNFIIYNESDKEIKQNTFVNYEEIYIPLEIYDNFLNEIILLMNDLPINQNESIDLAILESAFALPIPRINIPNIGSISQKITDKLIKNKQDIVNKTQVAKTSDKTDILNNFNSIVDNFVIEKIAPLIVKQYTKNIYNILSANVSSKFFKILRFFKITKIELIGGEKLFSKIENADFSFMFKEHE
jgi:hypothetical protein